MSTVLVNDIFDELSETTKRLSDELIFTNKCLKAFMTYKSFIDFISNKFIDNLDSSEENVFYRLSQNIEQILAEKTGKSSRVTFVTVKTIDQRPNVSQTRVTENTTTKSVVIKQLGTKSDNKVTEKRPEISKETQSEDTLKSRRIAVKRGHSLLSSEYIRPFGNSRDETESLLHKSKVTYSKKPSNLIPTPAKRLTQECNQMQEQIQSIPDHFQLEQLIEQPDIICDKRAEQPINASQTKVFEIKSANQMRQSVVDSEPEPNSCSDIVVIQQPNVDPIDSTPLRPKGTKLWCQSCKKFIATNAYSRHEPCRPYKWDLSPKKTTNQTTVAEDFVPEDNYPIKSYSIKNLREEFEPFVRSREQPLIISVHDLIDCPNVDCDERLEAKDFVCHMIYSHQQLYSFECGEKYCKKSFEIFSDFVEHYRTHNSDPKSKLVVRPKPLNFRCEWEGCQKVFKTRKTCSQHREIHSSVFYTCKWPSCEFTCKQRHVMDCHQSDHYVSEARPPEDPEQMIVCPKNNCTHNCQRKTLFEHLLRMHGRGNLPQYECTISGCNQKFYSKVDFNQHFMIHNGYNPLENRKLSHLCTYNGCNKNFDKYEHFKRHLLCHNLSQFLFCCRIGCDFKTKSRQLFVNHEKNHSEPAVCDWPACGRQFKLSRSLMEHIRTHTNDQCNKCLWPGCEFKTTRASALYSHMRCHTTVRNLKCNWPECGKTYKYRINYTEHMRTHNNDKPFACDLCQYKSVSSSTLNKHKRVCAKRFGIY